MTKAELKLYSRRERELNRLSDTIEQTRARLESPRIAEISDMPCGGTRRPDAIPATLARLETLLSLYSAIWDDLIDMQMDIENAIEKLDPLERTVIRRHYIDGVALKEIRGEIGYSKRQTERLHVRAITKMR